ncbi:MAG TPA: glycoside hydrolase family 5 protein [Stenotrophomonas sp.]|nr:glycoside hydrolase family 5 protein [Stenotrophomonas sp.]
MSVISRCLPWLLGAALFLPACPAFAQQRVLHYAGVNLAGAEFNSSKRPGTLFKDYTYPAAGDYAYFAGKGMNIVRLPFLWERLQPQPKGELDATQLQLIRKGVDQAKAQNLHVILDVHNYAKYNGARLGTDASPPALLVDLWTRLATVFKDDDAVIFGLMNEPNAVDATAWAAMAQASIDAIRATGARNLILVPGTAYTGAHSWASTSYGTPNATALANINDPANNFAFEVHQYLDKDYSGTSGECVSPTIGADKLRGVTAWLRQQGKRGFLGEFAGGSNETCMQALDGMLTFMEQNADVWLGWTYWAAGSWWPATYPFNVHPAKDGSEKPQMPLLTRHAAQATQ